MGFTSNGGGREERDQRGRRPSRQIVLIAQMSMKSPTPTNPLAGLRGTALVGEGRGPMCFSLGKLLLEAKEPSCPSGTFVQVDPDLTI